MQSNHAHSVLLRDLISRQNAVLNHQDAVLSRVDAVLSRQDEQARVLEEIRDRPYPSTPGDTDSSMVWAPPPSTSRPPSNYHDNCNSDNASIMSRRSTFSFRLGRPTYIDDLKASRAYKRLRHFGLGIDSSSDSVLSFDSTCSAGNWSMLSDITLGDLSVSQIAVLNLPIELADVSNPEPFQEPSSTEIHSRPKSRRRWSSRGRIHNAIENGNEFVIKTLLAMGVDIEELDSSGRTPLAHAAVKHQEAICKFLLEKGASLEALRAFTSGMDINERKLLDPLITKAMDNGSRTVTALRLLVLMALGANYRDDNWSNQSMMNAAISMSYELAVRAIIHLEPRVLVGIDIEGRTPFAYAYHLRRNQICDILLQNSRLDSIQTTTEVVRLEGDFAGRVHAAVEEKCPHLLWFLLGTVEKIGINGQTPLAHAAEAFSKDINYGPWNTESVKKMRPKPRARRCIDTTMQKLVQELVEKDYKSILVVLSLIEARDAEGWTPLASVAFSNNEALCEFLVGRGCTLCLDTEQKKQLKPKLPLRIHDAATNGYKTALQLLLDMGADVNEINSARDTALLKAVSNNHLSCVKILIERGADATISTTYGNVLHLAVWESAGSETMKFLLEHVVGTRDLVNANDAHYGGTPLHDCSYNSHKDIALEHAKMLVQAGATLTIKDRNRETPYERARCWERKELAKYLWSQLSPQQQAQETPPPPYW